MKRITQVMGSISGAAAVISFIGIFIAMLFTTVDVVLRTTVNKPILGSYELVELMMVCIVFSSFAYTQIHKGHVNVVIFLRLLPRRIKFLFYTLTTCLGAGIAGCVSYAAFLQVGTCLAKNYVSPTRLIPLYPFYFLEGVMMAIFTITLLLDAVSGAIAIFNTARAEEIESAWV